MRPLFISAAAILAILAITSTAASAADAAKSPAVSPVVNSTSPEIAQGKASVSVSVSPSRTSLNGGQSATFTAKVSGTSNTTVTWSLSPLVGTIANGVYQAPAIIASQQTVQVTATSVADPTKTASATVTLNPVVVTVSSSGSTSLTGGESATFTAKVSGTCKYFRDLVPEPQVGTITSGVYKAPAIVASQQTVKVIATSVADPTKFATATVTLKPVHRHCVHKRVHIAHWRTKRDFHGRGERHLKYFRDLVPERPGWDNHQVASIRRPQLSRANRPSR